MSSVNSRFELVEERICNFEDRLMEIMQPKEKKEWRKVERFREICDIKYTNTKMIGVLKGEEREKE